MSETKSVEFISYPADERIVWSGPANNRTMKTVKDEDYFVPSIPPWSTFNGLIQCSPDSWVGKHLLATNPKTTPATYKGKPIPGKEDWIRGMWTAPQDWRDVKMN